MNQEFRRGIVEGIVAATMSREGCFEQDTSELLKNLTARISQAEKLLFGPRAAGRPLSADWFVLLQAAYQYDYLNGGVGAEALLRAGPNGKLIKAASKWAARETLQAKKASREKTIERKFVGSFREVIELMFEHNFARSEQEHTDIGTAAEIFQRYGIDFDECASRLLREHARWLKARERSPDRGAGVSAPLRSSASPSSRASRTRK
jgi:hypothetical protein